MGGRQADRSDRDQRQHGVERRFTGHTAGTNVGSNNVTVRNLFTGDDQSYYSRGNHQLEAGGWVQRLQSNDLLAQDQYGQASFSTLKTFLQGTVELRAGFRSESSDGWNESRGRASNYALVNGVLQTNPVIGDSALTTNRAKFLLNPRVGFAWDVRGNGKTAVRGGFGVYHGLLDTLDYRLDQTAPFNTAESIKNIAVASLLITPGTPPPAGALVSPSNVQPDIATPTVLTWSLRLEQQVAPHTSLTAGYVGSHSYHQILSEDMNEPAPQFLTDGSAFYPAGSKNANTQLANSTSWVSQGVGLYNALQVEVRHDLAHGFQVRGDYTWFRRRRAWSRRRRPRRGRFSSGRSCCSEVARSGTADGAALDALFVAGALEDALDVNAGGDDGVGVEGAGVDEFLDFGDGDAGGGGHHRVEIAGGLSIDKVAGAIAFPGFDEGVVGAEPGFEQVGAAVEGAGFFAFRDEGTGSGGSEEGGDAGATGADAFGEGALRDEAEVELAFDDFFFEELVFADVGAGMGGDHAGFEHEAHAETVDAHVVGDGVEAGEAAAAVLFDEGVDEIFGDAAEAESAEHEGGAGGNVGDGGFGGGDDFVHVGSGLG
jgi:hypothetical protein